MERRARVRVASLIALLAVIVSLFSFRVYKLQSTQTEETIQEADSLVYYTTVRAARGQILDRNGTVLVTNRASYDLTIINYVLYNTGKTNQNLLDLIHTCQSLGVELVHHLPITETKPHAYLLEDMDTNWQSYFRKYLRHRSMDSDISAGIFMSNLRDVYNIPEDLSEEDAFLLAAVRYELELRSIEGIPLENYVLAEDVNAEALAAIIELGIPGVIVNTSTVREYKTDAASHLLGHTGKMTADEYEQTYKEQGYSMDAVVGKDGVELAFEEYLHGRDGLLKTTISSSGEILDQTYVTVPQPGGNVELTIDIGIQQTAYDSLEEWILYLRENGVTDKQYGMDAKGGAVVVLDVDNNEVLASVSYPGYDANTFNQMYDQLAADEEYDPLINRCLKATYEPGSIYKMVTGITAMEYADIGRHYEVVDEGVFTKFEGQGYAPACHIYRSQGYTHGTENMMTALRDSCNYYFYDVGLQLSINDMDQVAALMGLGEPTGSELQEYIGTRANRESKAAQWAGTDQEAWVDGDMLQASIGQSLNRFTPLQMAVYASTLANEGTRYKATFLRRVVSWDYQELLVESQPQILSTMPLDDSTVAMYKEGMILATGFNATADPFYKENYPIQVAAKTGTAQHGDGSESDNASMICFAPADEPELAIAIYVENGAQGGRLAYICMDIMDNYFSQTGKYETVNGENEVR